MPMPRRDRAGPPRCRGAASRQCMRISLPCVTMSTSRPPRADYRHILDIPPVPTGVLPLAQTIGFLLARIGAVDALLPARARPVIESPRAAHGAAERIHDLHASVDAEPGVDILLPWRQRVSVANTPMPPPKLRYGIAAASPRLPLSRWSAAHPTDAADAVSHTLFLLSLFSRMSTTWPAVTRRARWPAVSASAGVRVFRYHA